MRSNCPPVCVPTGVGVGASRQGEPPANLGLGLGSGVGWGWGPGLSTALGASPHLLVSRMCAAVPGDSIPGGDAHPILLAPPGAVRTHGGRSPLPPAAARGGWCQPAPGGLNPAASQQAEPEDCEELRLPPAPKESE